MAFLFAGFILFCNSSKTTKDLNAEEIGQILQEFTEARIGQYLQPGQTPRDNLTILSEISRAHGYSVHLIIESIKEFDREVYGKIFPGRP